MPAQLSDRELRLLRLRGQRLLPGTEVGSVTEAAREAFVIQAQDPPWAAQAVRARSEGMTLEGAREQAADGSSVRAWLMRNTIHLFAADDLAWMRPLIADRALRPAMNRFAQLGMDEAAVERYLDLLRERVARGPLPRAEARELVIGAGLDPDSDDGSRIYWIFQVAALRGVLAVSPSLDQKQAFVDPPPDRPLDRDEGYELLARRFLEAYGPATPRDLAYWGKVTVTDARRAFDALGPEEVATSRGPMWALPGTADPPDPDGPVVKLLPVWENYLLAHEDRTLIVPEPHDRLPGAGRPSATLDGLAFGHWRLERGNGSVTVVVEPFGPVPRAAREGLRAEAEDVGRFLGVDAELAIERG